MNLQSINNMLISSQSVSEFEIYLSEHLMPVSPNPDFVTELHQKLMDPTSDNGGKALRYGAIGIAGVISSLVIIATSIQATIALLGTIKLLRQLRLDYQKGPGLN